MAGLRSPLTEPFVFGDFSALSGSQNIPCITDRVIVINLVVGYGIIIFSDDAFLVFGTKNKYQAFFSIDPLFCSVIPYRHPKVYVVADFIRLAEKIVRILYGRSVVFPPPELPTIARYSPA